MSEQRPERGRQQAAPETARRERLADALRENLKRRKQQARSRRAAAESAGARLDPSDR